MVTSIPFTRCLCYKPEHNGRTDLGTLVVPFHQIFHLLHRSPPPVNTPDKKLCTCYKGRQSFSLIVLVTYLNRARMLNSEKVLLVLVCEIHFWVSCILYSSEICCLPFFISCFAKLGQQGKKDKKLFLFQVV